MSDALRSVEEHLAAVLEAAPLLGASDVALAAAAGRTLAEPVCARVDIPVFDNSAMDGFAVRHHDVASASDDAPVILRVVADLPAGTELDPPLAAGEAARIMTGSPLPAAADTVVPFEDTAGGLDDSLESARVTRAPRSLGAHIRRRGGDAGIGDTIVAAGERLGPFQLAAAAASGVATVTAHRRPRVAVVSTGSELAAPGATLRRGQIPESNSILLTELARAADADVVLTASVDDTDAAFLDILERAREAGADVIVTSGGVSAGAYEVVKNTLSSGGEVDFVKVAMQPGKPQAFGRLADGTLFFGLPGNPVSSAVSFEMFVRPALLAMQGRRDIRRPLLRLTAATGWRTPPGRRQYLPAAIDRADPAGWRVGPATAGGSGSHLAGGLARAEAYAVVPADVDAVEPGDPVDVMLIT
ncbi:molybdopterin molybdotransferase MoeA [Microbacterium sp. LRZ72]|uniref:molybdopterin molybdotransferase MoeA n=1 Tax=Microbacterium sp. LRZ72 TaxID=2942481 RepID=UPI0029A1F576|nr:gephyrin-like molybdotransferase Glp [Microbacterium sp. LRZ72]MDX2376849.1 molybdopterin molybdotransferase MoeA [Microbacterium sp. LRZ72]